MCTTTSINMQIMSTNALSTCSTAAVPKETPVSSLSSNKRSVRFEEDAMRRVKRRIVELEDVPASSDMTNEEKAQRWRQNEDHIETFLDVEHVAQDCVSSSSAEDENAYLHFAESYATAYNLCHVEGDHDEQDDLDIDESNIQRGLPLDEMILLGNDHAPTRGLETKIMPGLGAHRMQKKKEYAQSVLEVQRHLRSLGISETDASEGLATVSRCLSVSSKRFARAMGVVDGTWALLEYASESPPSAASTSAASTSAAAPAASSCGLEKPATATGTIVASS